MQPIGPILFPVDFSPRCRAIVPLVKAIAGKLGSKVALFYAIRLPGGFFALEREHPVSLDTEAMLFDARDELLRFVHTVRLAWHSCMGTQPLRRTMRSHECERCTHECVRHS